MAITYTSNLGLPQITDRHDETESVAAMIAMSTTLDALPGLMVVHENEVVMNDDEVVYNL